MNIPFNKPYMTGKELWYISQAHAKGHLAGDGCPWGRGRHRVAGVHVRDRAGRRGGCHRMTHPSVGAGVGGPVPDRAADHRGLFVLAQVARHDLTAAGAAESLDQSSDIVGRQDGLVVGHGYGLRDRVRFSGPCL